MARATLIRCAYKVGDALQQGDVMGMVIENDGRFYTAQMLEQHGSVTEWVRVGKQNIITI